MDERGSASGPARRDRSIASQDWRASVITRAESIRTAAIVAAEERGCLVDRESDPPVVEPAPGDADTRRYAEIANRVIDCAATADRYARSRNHPLRWLMGNLLEGAWANLHAAEEHLLDLLPDEEMAGHIPPVLYQVRRYLRAGDPRRTGIESRWRTLRQRDDVPTRADRALLRVGLSGVHYRNSVGYTRIRTLRNVQLGFAALFLFLAVLLALVAWADPKMLDLCVPTERQAAPSGVVGAAEAVVCPMGRSAASAGDVALVELVGLVGAAAATARALTAAPRPFGSYSIVVAQACLKMTLGAVTAVLGLIFVKAGAVPGVDDADTQAELLVYAVVFGYAQQLLTQLIDRRAAAAVESPGRPAPEDPDDPDDGGDGGPGAAESRVDRNEGEEEAEPETAVVPDDPDAKAPARPPLRRRRA